MGRLSNLLRVLNHIGIINGLCYYLKVVFSKKAIIKIRIKGVSNPFFLRKKSTDRMVFNQIFVDKQYSLLNPEFSPKSIIDAGANIGLATIYFANKYPNAKIFSIEPEHSNLSILKTNLLPYINVTLYPNAIYNIGGKELYINSVCTTNKDAFQTEELKNSAVKSFQEVKTITISDILKEHHLNYIDLLKIDIEGAEKQLFASNTENWLPRTKYIMIEIHDWMGQECSKNVFSAILKYDFSVHVQGEGLLLINNGISTENE